MKEIAYILVNPRRRSMPSPSVTNSGLDCLHIACMGGNLEACLFLLEKGMTLHSNTSFGITCLHAACLSGNLEIIQLCLDQGLDIKSVTNYGHNCLDYVCKSGSIPLVKFFLNNNLKPDLASLEKIPPNKATEYLKALVSLRDIRIKLNQIAPNETNVITELANVRNCDASQIDTLIDKITTLKNEKYTSVMSYVYYSPVERALNSAITHLTALKSLVDTPSHMPEEKQKVLYRKI